MVTVTGAWAPNGTMNQRMRLVLDYSVSAVSNGAVTVSGSVKVEAGYSFNDQNNTFAWSGSLLGSGSSAKSINVATGGSQQIHTFSQSVSVVGQPASSRTVTFSLTGIEYVGSSTKATVSATISIPAGQLSVPAAPTGPGATRISDTMYDLYWSAVSTTEAPIWNFNLDLETVGVGFNRLGNPGGSTRAWRTQTTKPDGRYRMRIRTSNSAGQSAWAYTGYWRTTPAAAIGLTAARTSGTTAELSWTPKAKWGSHQDVQQRTSTDDGATWTAWGYATGLTQLPMSATSAVINGLATGTTYEWRIQTAITTEATLYSHSASVRLAGLVPPGQPTLVSPSGTYEAGSILEFRWRHNSRDGSGQSAYELRHRPVGGEWSTVTGTSSWLRTLTFADPGLYEWQIRTKGQHADFGPWSSVGRWQMAHLPVATITTPEPGDTLTTNRLTVRWTSTDPQGASQTGWRAELVDLGQGGLVLESRTGSTTSVTTFSRLLVNGQQLRARVWVTSGTGLVSDPATVDVGVSFSPPQPPSLSAAWDEDRGESSLAVGSNPGVYVAADGESVVTPAAATFEGDGWWELQGVDTAFEGDGWWNLSVDSSAFAATASHAIERSLDGGETWERIAEGLPLNAGHGDWRVPLGKSVLYRAVALTDLGVEAYGEPVEISTESGRVWLHSVDGQRHASLQFNLSLNRSAGHQVETVQYLDDPYPTAHFGPARPESVSVSAATFPDEEREPLEPMLQQVVWYRDPEGRAWWAVIDSDITDAATSNLATQIGMTVRRVMPPMGVSA